MVTNKTILENLEVCLGSDKFICDVIVYYRIDSNYNIDVDDVTFIKAAVKCFGSYIEIKSTFELKQIVRYDRMFLSSVKSNIRYLHD